MKLKDVAAPPRFEFVLDDSVHNFGFGGIGGIVVSIAAFQAVDLGWIPSQCNYTEAQASLDFKYLDFICCVKDCPVTRIPYMFYKKRKMLQTVHDSLYFLHEMAHDALV